MVCQLKNSYKGAFAKIAKKLHRQTCSDSKPRVDTGVYGPEGKRNDVIISQPYLLHCGQLLNTGTKPKVNEDADKTYSGIEITECSQ